VPYQAPEAYWWVKMAKARQSRKDGLRGYGGGSMTERSPGVWRLRVMTSQGQVERSFRGSRSSATRELSRMCSVARTGRLDVGASRTFGHLLDEWHAHLESIGRAPKTLAENKREIERRIRPRLGKVKLRNLTARHLDDAYRSWLTEGLSPSSVRRHAAVVSSALSQAVKWGWLESSPATKSTPPPQRLSRTIVTPSPKDVSVLIKTAEERDSAMALAIALAFVTGARRGELCALRWSDFDLDAGVLRISRSISEIDNRLVVKGTKTDRSRTIALDDRTVAMLNRHLDWQRDLARRADSPLMDDPFLLSDNANAALPIRPNQITERFIRTRAKVGMPNVRFHDLRHASITQMLGFGVDIKTVSTRAGHASTRMTLDRYAHALPAGDIGAAAVLGALLPDPT
jgi:integrase